MKTFNYTINFDNPGNHPELEPLDGTCQGYHRTETEHRFLTFKNSKVIHIRSVDKSEVDNIGGELGDHIDHLDENWDGDTTEYDEEPHITIGEVPGH